MAKYYRVAPQNNGTAIFVEAQQFLPEKKPWPKRIEQSKPDEWCIVSKTDNGLVVTTFVRPGDWIVIEPYNRLMVCDPVTFIRHYKPAGDPK